MRCNPYRLQFRRRRAFALHAFDFKLRFGLQRHSRRRLRTAETWVKGKVHS
jgi:hypothetical protein